MNMSTYSVLKHPQGSAHNILLVVQHHDINYCKVTVSYYGMRIVECNMLMS